MRHRRPRTRGGIHRRDHDHKRFHQLIGHDHISPGVDYHVHDDAPSGVADSHESAQTRDL